MIRELTLMARLSTPQRTIETSTSPSARVGKKTQQHSRRAHSVMAVAARLLIPAEEASGVAVILGA